jgi:hypothetical protein
MWKEYDENNNLTYYKHSNGIARKYIVECYEDGQLKRYDTLLIPYFEKPV